MEDMDIVCDITYNFRKYFKVEAVEELSKITFADNLNALKSTLTKKQLKQMKIIENNFFLRLHFSIHSAITYSYFVTKKMYTDDKNKKH